VYVESAMRDGALHVELLGAWRAAALREIEAQLEAVPTTGQRVKVGTARLEALDTSGAWLLRRFLQRVGGRVEFEGGEPEALKRVRQTLDSGALDGRVADNSASPGARAGADDELTPVARLGRRALKRWQGVVSGVAFIGEVAAAILRVLPRPQAWRPVSIARHVMDTGLTAVPIVALIGFLISVIIAYMGAQQLMQFGADIFVVDLVTVGVLRELGVLLTAIIVAGRSGSAFAAEIGAMRLNEEVDALKATGVDPIEVLVLPRAIGLVIALPLLTVVADAVGLAGGALLCRWLLEMPFIQYFQRMDEAIGPMTFWVGIIKAPVFALLIAFSGVYRGMQVRGSSRELGRLTTLAVVQSIFLVILADALFAVLFLELGV
jgi:phospholipid/cholesterol/gamma-HCH transport system permease protein